MCADSKEIALRLIEELRGVEVTSCGCMSGTLSLTAATAPWLESLLEENRFPVDVCHGGRNVERPVGELIGQDVTVEFTQAERLFFKDFGDFLSDRQNSAEGPPRLGFYLHSCGRVLREDYRGDCNPDMGTYLQVVELNRQLRRLADHTQGYECFFLGMPKVSLDPRLSVELLQGVADQDLELLKAVLELLQDGLHGASKEGILRSRLVKLAETDGFDRLYESLVSKLGTFCNSFLADYELFSSEISVDKLRDSFLEQTNDYTKRLNDTITSIQGRLLSVPVATILAVSQMKPGEFGLNWGILLGSGFISILVLLSLLFQDHNLLLLEDELGAFERKLLNAAHARNALQQAIGRLRRRIVCHRVVLATLVVVVSVAYGCTRYYMATVF